MQVKFIVVGIRCNPDMQLDLDIGPQQTIRDVAADVAHKINVTDGTLRLIFQGRPLRWTDQVHAVPGLTAEAVIHVFVSAHGRTGGVRFSGETLLAAEDSNTFNSDVPALMLRGLWILLMAYTWLWRFRFPSHFGGFATLVLVVVSAASAADLIRTLLVIKGVRQHAD